ncbi:MAG: DUF971 domain-containing protein [bacterium]|nr:DUF971 domain-containing protein [bacterium]
MLRSPEEKKRRRPTSIELGERELLISWQDGQSSSYALHDLRLHCPCANCREARGQPHGPQLVGMELPIVTAASVNPTSKAKGFDPVGRYGIKIHWADGHDAGIYTFEMLRDFSAE